MTERSKSPPASGYRPWSVTPYAFAASARSTRIWRASNSRASGGTWTSTSSRFVRKYSMPDHRESRCDATTRTRRPSRPPRAVRTALSAAALFFVRPHSCAARPRISARTVPLIGAGCGAVAWTGTATSTARSSPGRLSRRDLALGLRDLRHELLAGLDAGEGGRRPRALLREDVESLEDREGVARERDACRERLVEREDGGLVSRLDRADDEVLQRAEEACAAARVAERQAVDEEDDAALGTLRGLGRGLAGSGGRERRGPEGRALSAARTRRSS